MRFLFASGVIVMLVLAVVLAADLSMVRPRPKPEIPFTSEKSPVEQVVIVPAPIIMLPSPPPTQAEKQAARLKILETELQEKRIQAGRIEQKLDQFLKGEEAKDGGGE